MWYFFFSGKRVKHMNKHNQYGDIRGVNLPVTAIGEALQQLANERIVERIWEKDYTIWSDNPREISNRLGWLHSHRVMAENNKRIHDLAAQVKSEGYQRVLLLGMGGSSLAPELFSLVLGSRPGYPRLEVLDSTSPGAIREKENSVNKYKTLFVVSTKSGSTVETISLMNYFYNRNAAVVERRNAGRNFIAITDAGSKLEEWAVKLNFRDLFLNDPQIGGRYSALSYFGLVPAALCGIDFDQLLQRAEAMAELARSPGCPPEGKNSPALLGTVLGILGKSGRDKVTLILSPPIRALGAWIEQLLAESTGKKGRGLLPVTGNLPSAPDHFSADRLFISISLEGCASANETLGGAVKAGHPVLEIRLRDYYDLGGELFRWMMATAVAGWQLGVNPFDQPNVEKAKVLTRKMVAACIKESKLPAPEYDIKVDGLAGTSGYSSKNLEEAWKSFLGEANPGDSGGQGRGYIAIQAYLKPDPAIDSLLAALQTGLQDLTQMAVTVGYGPRYLHSTGQLHKGDAGKGLFVQLTAAANSDRPIPDQPGSDRSSFSFGLLIKAQALGDRQALLEGGRKVIHFHLTGDSAGALKKLIAAL